MSIDERIDRLWMFAFKMAWRTLAFVRAYPLLRLLCLRYMVEIVNGARRPLSFERSARAKYTLLVLDYERFRGDVDIFSRAADMRVVTVSWNLLRYMLASYIYWPTSDEERSLHVGRMARTDFALARPGSKLYAGRERYRSFLRRFLPQLFDGLGIDVVMNSDFRYRREADLTRVANELGYPHICYHREAMYSVPSYYYLAVERHLIFAPFYGRIIAVQNAVTRKMFLESGMTEPDKIIIRGCPRMDDFLKKIQTLSFSGKRTQQIAYFSAPSGAQRNDWSTVDFFSTSLAVVRTLVELAREDRSLRVVLKMKDMHIGQVGAMTAVINEVAGSEHGMPNVVFETGRMAAHDVMLASDVVCAMQSTVALEAAIAGKPVILPHFRKLREEREADQVLMYQECRDLFDVPDDAEDLKRIIRRRLADPTVDEKIMVRRRALFEEHVSPLIGNATEISQRLIRAVAEEGRRLRTPTAKFSSSRETDDKFKIQNYQHGQADDPVI